MILICMLMWYLQIGGTVWKESLVKFYIDEKLWIFVDKAVVVLLHCVQWVPVVYFGQWTIVWPLRLTFVYFCVWVSPKFGDNFCRLCKDIWLKEVLKSLFCYKIFQILPTSKEFFLCDILSSRKSWILYTK